MSFVPSALSNAAQKTTEHLRRIARARLHTGNIAERRRLAKTFALPADLPHIDERSGYCHLPCGTVGAVDRAIEFCQSTWQKRGYSSVNLRKQHRKKHDYRATILAPRTYEEAPPIFDLALSDEVLAIAIDYLKQVPVLHSIELWATTANELMEGSQYYHLDGGNWYLRRAKFLFNANDVGPESGPFTFLPADVSRRVAVSAGRVTGRFDDDDVFKEASKGDEIALVGPAELERRSTPHAASISEHVPARDSDSC